MKKTLIDRINKPLIIAGLVATQLALVQYNTSNKNYYNIEDIHNKFHAEIVSKTNSFMYADSLTNDSKHILDIKKLTDYYSDRVTDDEMFKTKMMYRAKSGITLENDMKTVNQKKIEKTIKFERQWDYFVKNRNQIPKSLKQKIHNSTIKNLDCDYEKEIKNVKTIEDVMSQLYYFGHKNDIDNYGEKEFWGSFEKVHERKIDDCDGGAIYAAGALSDNGFPPYILTMFSNDDSSEGHVVFLYKTNYGNYGTLGINVGDNLYPRYKSIKDVVEKISKNIHMKDIELYSIHDLSKQFPNFIDNNKNNNVRHMYDGLRKIKK